MLASEGTDAPAACKEVRSQLVPPRGGHACQPCLAVPGMRPSVRRCRWGASCSPRRRRRRRKARTVLLRCRVAIFDVRRCSSHPPLPRTTLILIFIDSHECRALSSDCRVSRARYCCPSIQPSPAPVRKTSPRTRSTSTASVRLPGLFWKHSVRWYVSSYEDALCASL